MAADRGGHVPISKSSDKPVLLTVALRPSARRSRAFAVSSPGGAGDSVGDRVSVTVAGNSVPSLPLCPAGGPCCCVL